MSGVVLNWLGAIKLAGGVWHDEPHPDAPGDHAQMEAFAAGTAATFGASYLYLFLSRKPLVPQLVFGAMLKTWALVLSAILFAQGRLDRRDFLSFGISNGVVGGLFWIEIAAEVRAGRRS